MKKFLWPIIITKLELKWQDRKMGMLGDVFETKRHDNIKIHNLNEKSTRCHISSVRNGRDHLYLHFNTKFYKSCGSRKFFRKKTNVTIVFSHRKTGVYVFSETKIKKQKKSSRRGGSNHRPSAPKIAKIHFTMKFWWETFFGVSNSTVKCIAL